MLLLVQFVIFTEDEAVMEKGSNGDRGDMIHLKKLYIS